MFKLAWFDRMRRSKGFVLSVCALAIFSDIFFYGVIPPILPTVLEQRVHVASDKGKIMLSLQMPV